VGSMQTIPPPAAPLNRDYTTMVALPSVPPGKIWLSSWDQSSRVWCSRCRYAWSLSRVQLTLVRELDASVECPRCCPGSSAHAGIRAVLSEPRP
jgi:hypothetical protein